jgi:class 3 adenylate cyclase
MPRGGLASATRSAAVADAAQRYLLLADISGYTRFLAGVERTHGVDFSLGIPAGYSIIAALLDAVVQGMQPAFEVAKIEGDAVFAVAPAPALDGRGEAVLARLRTFHRAFREVQQRSQEESDHLCTACPVAGTLRLKVILHRGLAVHVTGAAHAELHGPAVNIVHRLLKNTVESRFGPGPYLLLTDEAAAGLRLTGVGSPHREEYPDVGPVTGRVIDLD